MDHHRSKQAIIILLATLFAVWVVHADVDHIPCNNQRCQPRVSFCLLTKDCLCDDFDANLTCASLCTKCLNDTYQDCCSCVGLCKASEKESDITKLSNVEMLPEPDVELFQLTSLAPEKPQDWHFQTLSFKLHFPDDNANFGVIPAVGNQTGAGVSAEVNCTVVYLAQCMAMNKCKLNCNSLGASAFRWFHNACCECIGQCDLAPYGDEEAKCRYCTGFDKNEADSTTEGMQGDEGYDESEESVGEHESVDN